MDTKRCSKCKVVQGLDEFSNHKRAKDGKQSECKTCGKEYNAKHRQKNIEYQKEHYQENEEYYKEYNKRYHQKNIEEYKKRSQKNIEKIKKYRKRYYQKNIEKYKGYVKKYCQKNPEKIREKSSKRRALKLKVTAGIVDYEEIKDRDKMNCYLCGEDITDDNYHFDHVYPLSKGGAHSMDNIKVTHARCNLVKHDRIIDEVPELATQ